MAKLASNLIEGLISYTNNAFGVNPNDAPTASSNYTEMHAEVRIIEHRSGDDDGERMRLLLHQAILSVREAPNGEPINVSTNDPIAAMADSLVVSCPDFTYGENLTINEASLPISNMHVYRLLDREPEALEAQAGDSGDESGVASLLWELPCRRFDGIWENLIFDDSIGNELLSYVLALVRLSEKKANSAILRVNRLILLYGPPGTGKTSLCKALSQKLSIRFGQKYKKTYFVEINSHSLFSKFFSESGKLIQNMFGQIEDLAENPNAFVFVLIDEVESLTMARSALLNRNEPADAVRAVNAVLTQIDRIRQRNNVFIFTTSNIVQSLDEAFTDRADLKRFVGYPSPNAIYEILRSCIREMQRIGIVERGSWFAKRYPTGGKCERLLELSRKAFGLSGRCLRQLPIIGYSKLPMERLSIDRCLELLELAVEEKLAEKKLCKEAGLHA